jgi:hypothetical protein
MAGLPSLAMPELLRDGNGDAYALAVRGGADVADPASEQSTIEMGALR